MKTEAELAEMVREVRDSRDSYLDAAASAVREVLDRQYPGLRAFALMDGSAKQSIKFTVDFTFSPKGRMVVVGVESEVQPPVLVDRAARRIRTGIPPATQPPPCAIPTSSPSADSLASRSSA